MHYKIKKGTKLKAEALLAELGCQYKLEVCGCSGALFANVEVTRADRAALRSLLNELQEKQDDKN